MHYLFEPGLYSSGPVRTALLVGAVVAVTSGVIGVFTATVASMFFEQDQKSDVAEIARRLDVLERKLDELLRRS